MYWMRRSATVFAVSTPLSLDEIPGPRGLPVVGNIFDIDAADPIEGFVRMAGEYGPIYKLATPAGDAAVHLRARAGRRGL